jgi:hypothetical protein
VGRWSYAELRADADWFHGWISFDSVLYNPNDKKLYCGLNSLDGDLLYAFDPEKDQFESMRTQDWTDAFDVKIHRTLQRDSRDGSLYFGTSMLHDLDRQQEAKGGKLVRFEPSTRRYDIIDVPAARMYLQSIAADWERKLIYSFTMPAEAVYKTDLGSRSSGPVGYIGNSLLFAQPHNGVVDRFGWLWGTYAELRCWDECLGQQPVRLFKYHPDGDRFVWYPSGLSRRESKTQLLPDPAVAAAVPSALDETRHKQDFAYCDSMAYDGGEYIYAGTVAGVLSRIDIETGRVDKVANVISGARFPALQLKDGILYGAGGLNGCTQLLRWDTRTEHMDLYTDLVDDTIHDRPARVHELAVADDHQIYLAENDNHRRSSYLWSVRLS